ncbi:MAG: hypothetical protein A2W23_00215 [Planctomycetes bacterium RBG_16_43_13]|nr:MAG: hypothetical protein A2W23_00215 [Planctomycetes bacterium RBG_16_43_13]
MTEVKNIEQIVCTQTTTSIICRYPKCKKAFIPKRRHQRFCSSDCRLEFFALAREMGQGALERMR